MAAPQASGESLLYVLLLYGQGWRLATRSALVWHQETLLQIPILPLFGYRNFGNLHFLHLGVLIWLEWSFLCGAWSTMLMSSCCLVAQSCLTLWDPMDCGPPGSSVHGILQARILGWVVISFSRGSSWCRDQTCISCIAGGFFIL